MALHSAPAPDPSMIIGALSVVLVTAAALLGWVPRAWWRLRNPIFRPRSGFHWHGSESASDMLRRLQIERMAST